MTDKIEEIRARLAYELRHPSACYELANDVRTLLAELDAAKAENEELRDALRLERLEHQDFRKMAMAMDKEMGADEKTIAALRDTIGRLVWIIAKMIDYGRPLYDKSTCSEWNRFFDVLCSRIWSVLTECGLTWEDAIGGDE